MLSRFHHIAVPLDFTGKNRSALEAAFEMATVNRSRVTLLHVVETLEMSADSEVQQFYNRLEDHARRELEPLCRRFTEAGLSAHGTVVFGRRTVQIVEFARTHGVDLIVMSSHPVDQARPLQSLATISYHVSLAAPCSVLLVKSGDGSHAAQCKP